MFQMQNAITAVLPELFVLGMACVVLLLDLFLPKGNKAPTYWLSLLTLLGAFGLTYSAFSAPAIDVFSDQLRIDSLGHLLKLGLYLCIFLIFLYGRRYAETRGMAKGEHYVLVLLSLLGMMLLVSANTLLMVYLGLELMSLPLYALIAMQSSHTLSSEAGMKYFVMGGLASGMLLYGMSLLFGLTNTLVLSEIATQLPADSLTGLFGMTFIVIGFAFKFGAVPFHMWIPDVYEGSPTEITMLVASAPKIAAFGMAYRLLYEGMPTLSAHWSQLLWILALLSIGVGNVLAIAQTHFKRMLGYSTISHIGFVLLGLMVGTTESNTAALYYVLLYAIMTAGAFGILLLLSHVAFDLETLDDFKGLNQQHPWMAFLMLLLMFSLAGVPPMAGFYAKFVIMKSLIDAGYLIAAIAAMVFSVIGAYYYLRVVRMMYFESAEEANFYTDSSAVAKLTLSANGLAVLALGILPAGLYALCQSVL